MFKEGARPAPVYLNALRAFEAAARLQSFAAAADELNVSPPAISHLIRSLEEYVGRPLFIRSRSGVVLTAEAASAFPDIRAGFDSIGSGLQRLRRPVHTNIVTMSVTPAFAAKWLLPRIEAFRAEHPQFDIRLDSTNRLVDFLGEGIDVGVRYGSGSYPQLKAERMMGESVFPVCAPQLASKLSESTASSEVFANLRLIHDTTMDFDPTFPTWAAWMAARGLRMPTGRTLQINASALAIEAAINGQGIALGRGALVAEDLASGRLVRPFATAEGDAEKTEFAYYVVYPEQIELPERVQAVRDWLLCVGKHCDATASC